MKTLAIRIRNLGRRLGMGSEDSWWVNSKCLFWFGYKYPQKLICWRLGSSLGGFMERWSVWVIKLLTSSMDFPIDEVKAEWVIRWGYWEDGCSCLQRLSMLSSLLSASWLSGNDQLCSATCHDVLPLRRSNINTAPLHGLKTFVTMNKHKFSFL